MMSNVKKNSELSGLQVKKANLLHHDQEAEFFEIAHPEGSSVYEKSQALKIINFIADNSGNDRLCIDVGCGTGFITGFELSRFNDVVALDISRKMIEVTKKRFGSFDSLGLIVCDAEYLPLRSGVVDLVSVSSVLHHLPRPFHSILKMIGILKRGGFLYITREPNDWRIRRFFAFFDKEVIHRLMRCFKILRNKAANPLANARTELDPVKVDVHYQRGFQLKQLIRLATQKRCDVNIAYSYHWIYPPACEGLTQTLLSRSNFLIERIPFSKKLGRYVCLVARKLE